MNTRPNRTERDAMKAEGIVCTLCLYYGTAHDGGHLLPASGAGAVLSALSKRADR